MDEEWVGSEKYLSNQAGVIRVILQLHPVQDFLFGLANQTVWIMFDCTSVILDT